MSLVTTLLSPSSSTFSGDITASGLVIDGVELLFKTGTLSNANLTGMYATPVELIAAPGLAKAIIMHRAFLQHEYSTAAFTGGGSIVIQYDDTANGAGIQATNDISSGLLTAAFQRGQMQNGQLPDTLTVNYENIGIYISNTSAAFATGDGTASYVLWYSLIDV